MAVHEFKKGAFGTVTFVLVDSTDFATVESGITAIDDCELWGIRHGSSDVPSLVASGTSGFTKAAAAIYSGIMQHIIAPSDMSAATGSNFYDEYIYRASAAGAALVVIPIKGIWTTTSNVSNYLSNFSNYLSNISLIVSDAHSAAILGASHASNVESALDSQFAVISNYLSNASNYLSNISAQVSDMHSDMKSEFDGIVITIGASDVSDIASAVVAGLDNSKIASAVWGEHWAVHSAVASSFGSFVVQQTQGLSNYASNASNYLSNFSNYLSNISLIVSNAHSAAILGASAASDVYSRLELVRSNVSDVQSALDSQFAYVSAVLSDFQSDMKSEFDGVTFSLDASDISDIASAVWGQHWAVHSAVASSFGSFVVQQIQGLSNHASVTSDIVSDAHSAALRAQSLASDAHSMAVANSAILSDIYSALSNFDSKFDSRISSAAVNLDSAVSAIWAAKYTGNSVASSFGSLISDIYSRLALTQSNVSDIQSALDSQFTYVSAALSDFQSDMKSEFDGVTFSLDASDISDIVSGVWSAKYNTYSNVNSGIASFLVQNTQQFSNMLSNISDIVSDAHSAAILAASHASNVESALDSQFVYLSAAISDAHSDIKSGIGGISVALTASDISDIASQVVAAISPSDIASAVWGEHWAVHSAVASSFGSFLVQQTQGASNLLSNISLIASDAHSAAILAASHASNAASAASAARSEISNIESALDSQFAYLSAALSDFQSDVKSEFDNLTFSISASDVSDIASAVWGEHWAAHSAAASSFGSFVVQQTQGMSNQLSGASAVLSDTYSLVSNVESALDSQFAVESNYLSNISAQVSDAHSAAILAASHASNAASAASAARSEISNVESALDSQFAVITSAISDIESQIDAGVSIGTGGITTASFAAGALDAAAVADELYGSIKKNAAFSNFEFLMTLSADGSPATGKTVTGQRSIDGQAFSAVGGSIAEVSNGIYQFDAAAADTNGNVITWRFSEADCNDRFFTFKTVS